VVPSVQNQAAYWVVHATIQFKNAVLTTAAMAATPRRWPVLVQPLMVGAGGGVAARCTGPFGGDLAGRGAAAVGRGAATGAAAVAVGAQNVPARRAKRGPPGGSVAA